MPPDFRSYAVHSPLNPTEADRQNRVLKGGSFTFLVGEEAEAFEISSAIVASLSPALKSLMENGRMKESQSRVARLEDVEPLTFVSFAEFAYTGIYHSPTSDTESCEAFKDSLFYGLGAYECTICPTRQEVTDPAAEYFPWCSSTCKSKKRYEFCVCCASGGGCVEFRRILCAACATRLNVEPQISLIDKADKTPLEKSFVKKFRYQKKAHMGVGRFFPLHEGQRQEHSDFLHHAKLYVFADKYLILDLRSLCLYQLHNDLVNVTMTQQVIGELVDLLTYSYENTVDVDASNVQSTGKDRFVDIPRSELRDLVVAFASLHAKTLISDERFRAMLVRGGQQCADFIKLALAS